MVNTLVTKLNSKVKIGFYEANWSSNPEPWAQPVIRVTVEAENPKNANLTGNFPRHATHESTSRSFYDLFK